MTATDDRSVWSALPVPGVLVDRADRISDVTPSGEVFFNAARKSLIGRLLTELLPVDVPLSDNLARVRDGRSALFHRDLQLSRPGQDAVLCDLQIAAMSDAENSVLVILHPRQIAELGGGQLARMTGAQVAALTHKQIAEIGPRELNEILPLLSHQQIAKRVSKMPAAHLPLLNLSSAQVGFCRVDL